jgi:CelD/BcsL family acetyltransferase involved in cellulose biosynthesis
MKRLDITMKRPSELDSVERGAWRDFTASNACLASPYFALEFAECCEEARSDTRVLVAKQSGRTAAFLPLHTGRFGYARPLGGPLSDVHGLIAAPDSTIDPAELLRGGHIPVFDFHCALASQAGFRSEREVIDGSWLLDLSDGYEAWLTRRREVASKAVRNIRTRQRRLGEVDGGYRYVMADTSRDAFETMIKWKQVQYRRTGVFDVFSVAWTRRLLEAILKRTSDSFSGVCSSLYINDQVAAVHVGMASDRVCHYWFPAYDEDMSRLSPGLLLLVEMARTAASLGHLAMELGPGRYPFKKDLSSYQIGLVSGCIARPSVQSMARSASRAITRSFEAAPLGSVSAWPGKAFRKLDRVAGFYEA